MIEGQLFIYYVYEDRDPAAAHDQMQSPEEYAEQTWISLYDAERMVEFFGYDRPAVNHTIDFDLLVSGGTEFVEGVVQYTKEVYHLTEPTYVFSVTQSELDAIGMEEAPWGIESPIDAEAFADGRIPQPMSLMLLPPAMVETYGREWLHDLPAARIEDLDDDAVLILAAEEFGDCENGYDVSQCLSKPRRAFEEAFAERAV